jgi:hypothetical protein
MLMVVRGLPVCLLSTLLMVALSSRVDGSWVDPGDSIVVSSSLSDSRGGPFLATNLSKGLSFQTLCLEISELFYPGRTYYATIEDKALFGGGGAVGGADPLGIDTAYLYKSYVRNTLNGTTLGTGAAQWVFSNADKAHLRALQDAVWYLEEEKSLANITQKAKDLVTWVTGLGSDVKQTASNVRVMNLWTSARAAYTWDGRAQSMLTIVPEPASLAGWLGVSGIFLGGWCWRRNRRNRVA